MFNYPAFVWLCFPHVSISFWDILDIAGRLGQPHLEFATTLYLLDLLNHRWLTRDSTPYKLFVKIKQTFRVCLAKNDSRLSGQLPSQTSRHFRFILKLLHQKVNFSAVDFIEPVVYLKLPNLLSPEILYQSVWYLYHNRSRHLHYETLGRVTSVSKQHHLYWTLPFGFKTPIWLGNTIIKAGEPSFLVISLRIIPIVLPNSIKWSTSPDHQTNSPIVLPSDTKVGWYSACLLKFPFGDRKLHLALEFTLSSFRTLV